MRQISIALDDSDLDGSCTQMHVLVVYVIEGLTFVQDLSLENCRFLCMFSTGFTSFSVFLLFPLLITFFVFVHSF